MSLLHDDQLVRAGYHLVGELLRTQVIADLRHHLLDEVRMAGSGMGGSQLVALESRLFRRQAQPHGQEAPG